MITVKQMRKILETVADENELIYIAVPKGSSFMTQYYEAIAYPKFSVGSRSFECKFNEDPLARNPDPVCYEVVRKEII